MLLPAGFVKEIATDIDDNTCGSGVDFHPECIQKRIRFGFFINSAVWYTAHPNDINLHASATNLPDWLIWEPFPKDGYTEEERIWIALHEFAHRYDESGGLHPRIRSIFETESSPTFYGCIMGYSEDFADTFALYVMFPDSLKPFPLRYKVVKNITGREFDSRFSMPNSIRSKLAVPVGGCKQYDDELSRRRQELYKSAG